MGLLLAGGEELCVVPNSCTGAGEGRYSGLRYSSLAAYMGRTVADVNPIPAAMHGDLGYSVARDDEAPP